MSDDDVRALFHRIDDGPPLGIDVHEVMAGGRRVRTRRTTLTVASSTLAVTAIVAIGLTVARDASAPEIIQPAIPPTTSTTSTTTPAPSAPGPDGSPTTGKPGPDGTPGSGDTTAGDTDSPPAPGKNPPSGGAPSPGGAPGPDGEPPPASGR